MIPSLLFWLSIGSILYAYIGYPLVLRALTPFLSRPVRKQPWTPPVTLVVSAYNEQDVIGAKIENSLALDYPRGMLEIMVVSDASTDGTDDIVRGWSSSGVRLFRVEGRLGKTACLNLAVPEARGDIVIFSDANSFYDRNAVRELVANFADPCVGCVTGHTKYLPGSSERVGGPVGFYAKLEKATKKMESSIGSCVGADGAIFAIRKELYQPLKATDINDFVIPLNVIRQGFRTVLEEGAWCYEETAPDVQGEFSRQVRITNRTLRAILKKKRLLGSLDRELFSFELFSHKTAKFLVPVFLASALTSSLALARSQGMYRAMAAFQALFYALAVVEMGMVLRLLEKLMSLCRTFFVVNAAILNGWVTYLRGEDYRTWKTIR